ncbi:HxlR family transcriptional regulator [Kribbella sp. VKM Ac-2569]|uniref:winged helix-turn-helix transcriptional regulator n=1 Tax=Kribbella sp. VKM Ac-2569 TaxID=2512220 RepID=UPI00102C4CCA|nr:helix-turn-helix domain-containing protein [Kribbella sp. VKM Ac-2569]RZT16870.1 HxlR family transcriptional regulator [Kribbella sp. VKM Ac-2569]
MEDRTSGTPGHPEVTARRGDLFSPACPTRRLLDRVGSRWVVMIVKTLAESGELRYADLKRRTPGVSAKMLTQTLRGLEEDQLVTRRVEPSIPPAVYYALTPLGLTLDEPLAALREWAETHMPEIDARRSRAGRLRNP